MLEGVQEIRGMATFYQASCPHNAQDGSSQPRRCFFLTLLFFFLVLSFLALSLAFCDFIRTAEDCSVCAAGAIAIVGNSDGRMIAGGTPATAGAGSPSLISVPRAPINRS